MKKDKRTKSERRERARDEEKRKSKKRDREDEGKSRKRSDMDDLKEMWDQQDDEGGEGDDTILKIEEGKTTLRALPIGDPEDDNPFFKQYGMHYNMGPDGQESFRCIEPDGPFGLNPKKDKKRRWKAKLCPSCKKFCKNKTRSRAMKFGTPEAKKFWAKHVKPFRAKLQFLMAVCKPKAKDEETRNKAYVLRCGQMIAKPLIEARYDSDVGDITSIKRGRNFKVVKKKLSKSDPTNVEYKVTILDKSKLENWDELKENLPDLDTFLPDALDPEAIIEIMNGDGADDDDRPRKKGRDRDEDVDDDEDLDDDDDESERKLKTRKRQRGEDEEVDPDAEEEDDDDEPKKKGKKSKTREKLAKKASRDDDDDDDDDEDEDEEDDDADDQDDDSDDEDEDADEDLDDEDDEEEDDDGDEDDEDDEGEDEEDDADDDDD